MMFSTATGASMAAAAAMLILSGAALPYSASAEPTKCATGKVCKDKTTNACKTHTGCS